jgi:hypothetical protein
VSHRGKEGHGKNMRMKSCGKIQAGGEAWHLRRRRKKKKMV